MKHRRRALRPNPASVAAAVLLPALLLLAACGVEAGQAADQAGTSGVSTRANDGDIVGADITTTAPSTSTTTTLPPTDLEIKGDDGSPANKTVANAIVDLTEWWSTEFPRVFGKSYSPPQGGYFAIDSNTSTDGLPCSPNNIEQVLGNAYYCPEGDAVVWDQEGLMPDLVKKFGDFAPALVIAHEWGHAIQDRARFDAPTVILEQQADCYAGAWVKHVKAEEGSRFSITTDDLDRALAGFLSLRDAPPGSSASDPNAHGSGFDRVRAFQEGFERGAARCAEYRVGDPKPFQFEFSSQEELDSSGNLPLEGTDGIVDLVFPSLDAYWADEFPKISDGKKWNPMGAPKPFQGDQAPDCNGQAVTGFRLFVCIPDRFVAFDESETIPAIYKDNGDFGVATLFATQYGLDAQDQLGSTPDEGTATLRGDCYAGAYSGSILPGANPDATEGITLSPGDLDEAVGVLLSTPSNAGPGFERVRAFGIGVTKGATACAAVKPS